MYNKVLTYYNKTLKKDVDIMSKVSFSHGRLLSGYLNINLFDEFYGNVGDIRFEIKLKTLDNTTDNKNFDLSLSKIKFIKDGKIEEILINKDATFLELVAQIIDRKYGIQTKKSYSYNINEQISQKIEEIKNI